MDEQELERVEALSEDRWFASAQTSRDIAARAAIHALIAEVRALRAERDELRSQLYEEKKVASGWMGVAGQHRDERDVFAAERDEARAELARMRETLDKLVREALAVCDWARPTTISAQLEPLRGAALDCAIAAAAPAEPEAK